MVDDIQIINIFNLGKYIFVLNHISLVITVDRLNLIRIEIKVFYITNISY